MWLMVVVLLCNVFLCKLAHIGLQPVKWCTKVLSYSNRNDDKYPPSRWKQLIVLSLNIHWTIKIPSGVNPMFIFFFLSNIPFRIRKPQSRQTLYFLVFIDDICNVVLSRANAFGLCLLGWLSPSSVFFYSRLHTELRFKTREREIYELLITLLVFAKCLSRNKFPFLFWLLFAIEF